MVCIVCTVPRTVPNLADRRQLFHWDEKLGLDDFLPDQNGDPWLATFVGEAFLPWLKDFLQATAP
jgi:hypothetical protein